MAYTEKARLNRVKSIQTLSDSYIRSLLTCAGIKKEAITPERMVKKRMEIIAFRNGTRIWSRKANGHPQGARARRLNDPLFDIKRRESNRKYEYFSIANLSDSYIRVLLRRQHGYKAAQVSAAMIKDKREKVIALRKKRGTYEQFRVSRYK